MIDKKQPASISPYYPDHVKGEVSELEELRSAYASVRKELDDLKASSKSKRSTVDPLRAIDEARLRLARAINDQANEAELIAMDMRIQRVTGKYK